MRIRTFCKYLDLEEVQDHTLRDCTVVVDGQNFFYNLYQKSGLPSLYGCEGDKYANYLRKFLGMFKMANIQCYFIFKGGDMDINYKIKKLADNWRKNDTTDHYFAQPVFMKELYKQVLHEMGFDYAVCEYEVKAEVIAFANKYNCPVMSFDIEYCFSGIPYIPYSTISGCNSKGVKCGLFNLQDFLEKYNITIRKLAIFIVLTDENIFGEGFFMALFKRLNMPTSAYKRNISLLKWLGRLPEQSALSIIYMYVEKTEFDDKLQEAYRFIQRHETTGIPTKFMESKNKIDFIERDPDWFAKGVTMGRIAINYVNLYRYNIYFGAWTIEDENADDSLLCSLDIIIYAFNLLTNFEKQEFIFHDKNDNKRTISSTKASYGAVRKPSYDAVTSPFENGWDQLKNLRLFEHFLEESLQGFDHAVLQQAPDDVRLLIVALVYFSRQKTTDTTNIVCSVLLSYVMLGVVFDKLPGNAGGDLEITKKPYLDSTLQKESVNERDCVIANNILQKYFQLSISESHKIFKESLIHPFVEFQHCLVQLNNLNNLCGSSYKPTEYSKTFNGTFAYKLLVAAEADEAGNGLEFIKKLLNPAATVLSLFNGLFELYEQVLSL